MRKVSWLRSLFIVTTLVVVGLLVYVYVVPQIPFLRSERQSISLSVDDKHFDFVTWEVDALVGKVEAALVNAPSFLDDSAESTLVKTYLEEVSTVRRLGREIENVFASSDNADVDSAELQAQLAERRAEMERLQPVAEAILETQVATIVKAEDFDVLGGTWPPVKMHMTSLPLMLIISPRDRIEQQYAFPLVHGLTIPEQEALETLIAEEYDFSTLVVPIGGLALYPAMIIETANLTFLTDVIAHEWAHHWLGFRPLGYGYGSAPETRIINETVASVFGTEAGESVLRRYYPELAPPPVIEEPEEVEPAEEEVPEAAESPAPEEPVGFDFRATMRDTRIGTDNFLAEGDIEGAEQFMEAQRQLFIAEGYTIRKINQAYFAFYGAYADSPGATGSNPIGPSVLDVRERTDSLRHFLDVMAPITTLEELEAVLNRLPAE